MSKKISDIRKFAKGASNGSTDLATERQRARERIRYVKPEIAGKVLGHDRYWTVQFLDLYLERCDETAFDVPRDAYLLAQHLPEVARRIRVGPKAREWDTPLEKMGGIVMALAVKGSCCRACGEFEEARLNYERAFKGLKGRKVSAVAMAELHRRFATLQMVQGEEDALEHVEASLSYCEEGRYLPGRATALNLRGIVQRESDPGQSMADFVESIRLSDLRSGRGLRTAESAFHNTLALVADGSVGLRDQEAALKLIHRLKGSLKGTPTSVRKLRTLWLEGRLLGNLRIGRHAIRQLSKARIGLLKLGQLVDFAIVSVELAHVHLLESEPEEALEVARTAEEELGKHKLTGKQIEVVLDWCKTEISLERTESARLKLLSRN